MLDGFECRDAAQHESGSPRAMAGNRKTAALSGLQETPLYSFADILWDGRSPPETGTPRTKTPKPATPPVLHPVSLPDVKFQMGKIYGLKTGVLGFACFQDQKQTLNAMKQNIQMRFFTSDHHAEYNPFGADFGVRVCVCVCVCVCLCVCV